MKWFGEYFDSLPIPQGDSFTINKVGDLVTQITRLKKLNSETDTTQIEKQIDQLLYKLYGLTKQEIAIVEQGTRRGRLGCIKPTFRSAVEEVVHNHDDMEVTP